MTNNREDYLQAIFRLKELGEKVTNKKIAEHLNIAPASVSEMLKKLQAEGLIQLIKNEVLLTEEGERESKRVLSCHRLWETFLLQNLNYNWQDVHEQADLLEHVTNEDLKNHLNRFLNYPKTCPHGSIIYENWTDEVRPGILLGKLKAGQKAQIIKVDDGDRSLLAYLDRMNIALFDELEVVGLDEFDGSLCVLIHQKEVIISSKALTHILVQLL